MQGMYAAARREPIDCVVAEAGPGWGGAELADLKSVQRQLLLIWLNQRRQMQAIHNSGNLWILHWALTYITMTSKHNFRRRVFGFFLLLWPSLSCRWRLVLLGSRTLLPPPTLRFTLTRLINTWL